MYIGNNKIQDIYIGNNKIEKAYIGNNLVYEGVIPATFKNAMRAELGPMGDEFIPMEHTTLQAGLYYADFYVTTPNGAEINLLDAEHKDTIILKSNIEKTSITSQKLDQTFDVLYAPSVGNVDIRFTHSGKVYKVITEAHQLYKLLPEPSSSTFSFNDPDKAERTLHTFTQITFPDFNVTQNLSDMISQGRMRSEYYIGTEKISSGTFDIKYLPDYGNGKQDIRFTLGNVFYNKPNYTPVSIEYKHSFTVQNSADFPSGYNYISYIQDTQQDDSDGHNPTNHSTIALPITMDKTKKYSIDAVIEPTGIFRQQYYGNAVFYGQQNTGGGICQGMGMFYNDLYNNQLVFTFFQRSGGSIYVTYDHNNLTGKKMHIEHSSEHAKVTFIDTDEVLIDDDITTSNNSNDYPSAPFHIWGGGIESYYNDSVAPIGFKLYSFKLSIDDELVYDLMPAQEIETGTIGLVNAVDGTFYSSINSEWPFISDDVNEYKILSYDVSDKTDASITSTTPIKLFHRFTDYEYINEDCNVYDVKIYDNDNLIRHYIPVKRLSDNKIGLYDEQNKTFHLNEVTDYSFISGPTTSNFIEEDGEQKYEILNYIKTALKSSVNTNVLVNGTTTVDMTLKFTNEQSGAPRLFSSNDSEADWPGWHEPGTWGLQFEDNGTTLSIKIFGADYNALGFNVVERTRLTFNDIKNKKMRFNLTSAGHLNVLKVKE